VGGDEEGGVREELMDELWIRGKKLLRFSFFLATGLFFFQKQFYIFLRPAIFEDFFYRKSSDFRQSYLLFK